MLHICRYLCKICPSMHMCSSCSDICLYFIWQTFRYGCFVNAIYYCKIKGWCLCDWVNVNCSSHWWRAPQEVKPRGPYNVNAALSMTYFIRHLRNHLLFVVCGSSKSLPFGCSFLSFLPVINKWKYIQYIQYSVKA